jgi:hypothetical protein
MAMADPIVEALAAALAERRYIPDAGDGHPAMRSLPDTEVDVSIEHAAVVRGTGTYTETTRIGGDDG